MRAHAARRRFCVQSGRYNINSCSKAQERWFSASTLRCGVPGDGWKACSACSAPRGDLQHVSTPARPAGGRSRLVCMWRQGVLFHVLGAPEARAPGIPALAHSGTSRGCGARVMMRKRAMTSMTPDLIEPGQNRRCARPDEGEPYAQHTGFRSPSVLFAPERRHPAFTPSCDRTAAHRETSAHTGCSSLIRPQRHADHVCKRDVCAPRLCGDAHRSGTPGTSHERPFAVLAGMPPDQSGSMTHAFGTTRCIQKERTVRK